MDIAWFRDVSVIVLAVVVVAIGIVIGVIAIKLYRRVKPVVDSIKATAANVKEISSFVKEAVVKPLPCGIEWFTNMFQKEKGETDEQ